ncbi:lymphatic vessel endothelial hyaluronic receptor 1b [Chaetodon trifascialis]|uniref:lymphatic vessel endothelial hyaluronic receptor 1b n=1 Tax=Chaetodon trifascialis TaxID=109706 RepID=UPI003993C9EE
MARYSFFSQFLLSSFAACFLASNPIKAVPQSYRATGVFMVIEGGKYTFNFTAARAACLLLNVTMATRAQMERAVQHGLQTCKFGWTAEHIAVVPRLTADQKCGNGKTGVVTWAASTDKKFGVFCFNASALEEAPNRSTTSPQSSTFSTTLTALTQTTPAAITSPPSRQPGTMEAPQQTSVTSAFTLLIKTTHLARIPSTSTTLRNSTHIPTSVSHLLTSKPTVPSFSISASAHASNSSVSSGSVRPSSVRTRKPLGDVPTALIILGIILLLLTAAGAVWYYKLNIFTFWPRGQQKDDTETEMWKHTDSEMDLHNQHEGEEGEEEEEEEEEDSDRKYSSDITLCVNPDMKTNSSE